jgi:UDP-glucose 4-epimerase
VRSVCQVIATYERVTGVALPKKVVARRVGDVGGGLSDTDLAAQLINWRPGKILADMCGDSYRSCCSQLQIDFIGFGLRSD